MKAMVPVPVVTTPMYMQFNSEHHGRLPIFQSWKTTFHRKAVFHDINGL